MHVINCAAFRHTQQSPGKVYENEIKRLVCS